MLGLLRTISMASPPRVPRGRPDREPMSCKPAANDASLGAGQPIRASDDNNIKLKHLGATDAAHRTQGRFDWLRGCRAAATGLGGAAKIPGRPDLAANAAG